MMYRHSKASAPIAQAFYAYAWRSTILLLLVFAACAKNDPTSPTPGGSQSVSGVLQTQEGYAVPDASVKAYDQHHAVITSDTTNESGAFTLNNLPADISNVTVEVAHPDYQPASVPLATLVTNAGGTGGTVTGDKLPGISYTVLDEDSCCGHLNVTVSSGGSAVGDVQVLVRRGDHGVASGNTNGDGHILFSHLCAGQYNIRISKTGYKVVERDFTIEHCDSENVAISLEATTTEHHDTCCSGIYRIQLHDSTGASLNGATVTLTRNGVTRTATTEDGHVIFHELCEGTYSARIALEHYRTLEFSLTTGCSDSNYTVRVMSPVPHTNDDSCCHASITLTVHDSVSNETLTGGTATLWRGSTQVGSATIASPTRFEHLCPGTYSISLSKDTYRHAEFEVVVECNETTTTSHVMASEVHHDTCCGGSVSFGVHDSLTAAAIQGATVSLYKSGTLVGTASTNDGGNTHFASLCEGNYRVTLVKDGYAQGVIEFELGCNQSREFSKKLLSNVHPDSCCSAHLSIRVKDSATNAWINGAVVSVHLHDHTITNGETAGEGTWTSETICGHTTYTITVTKDGYTSQTIAMQIGDCTTYSQIVTLVHH